MSSALGLHIQQLISKVASDLEDHCKKQYPINGLLAYLNKLAFEEYHLEDLDDYSVDFDVNIDELQALDDSLLTSSTPVNYDGNPSREFYIGNISLQTSEDEIKKFLLQKFGHIESFEWKTKSFAQKGSLPIVHYCFVKFAKTPTQFNALRGNDTTRLSYNGQPLRVALSKKEPVTSALNIHVPYVQIGFWKGFFGHQFVACGAYQSCHVVLDKKKRNLTIEFSVGLVRNYFVFDLSSFRETKVIVDDSTQNVYITMWRPPRLYYGDNSNDGPPVRLVDFTTNKIIGQCPVYVLCRVNQDVAEAFSKVNVNIERRAIKASRGVCNPLPVLYPEYLATSINYLIHCLVTHNILYREHINDDICILLLDEDEDVVQDVLRDLLYRYRQKKSAKSLIEFQRNPIEELLRLMKEAKKSNRKKKVKPDNVVSINRLYVTPTKIYAMDPEVESKNRVLRMFPEHFHHFIRVSFTDEDFKPISHSDGIYSRLISDRVLPVLSNGIDLLGKTFSFLMYSSSSLRQHSAWFVAPFKFNEKVYDANSIRNCLGDFRHILVASKYAARVAQAFSSTSPTITLQKHQWHVDDDILSPCGMYVFSDGIGTISPDCAEEICKKLGKEDVSGFQIRCGGNKGMLVVDPNMRYRSPLKVIFRKSMEKFTAGDVLEIEVIRTTGYMQCYLNRQIITLLDAHKVPPEIVLSLQQRMLDRLRNAHTNPDEASHLLRLHFSRKISKETDRIIKHAGLTLSDPYIQGLISAFKAQHIHELETKARVHIEDGCCLIGGLDEYAVLKPRQVFVQYTNPRTEKSIIHIGPVMVAKFPCLHPGDVLLLEAVDAEELQSKRDVILFPQTGDRPLPNQTAGSDLDGDIYFITWNEALFPSKQTDPMDYSAPKPPPESHPDKLIEDVIKFFGKYITNDNLGRISTAHLAMADITNAFDKDCLEMAKLSSLAVDFAKTGVPAEFPLRLVPSKYPHFLKSEYARKEIYKSEKILGRMYDDVQEVKKESIGYPDKVRVSSTISVPNFESYMNEAHYLCEDYVRELKSIMRSFNIKSEAVAISGSILKVPKYIKKKEWDARQLVMEQVNKLRSQYRNKFEEDLKHLNELSKKEVGKAKAYAWYYVCYSMYDATTHPYLSFPWIVADYLLEISFK